MLKAFGTCNARAITTRKCEDWVSRRAPQCKAATFNIDRETLTSILKHALDEGIIFDNPARVIKKRKRGKTDLRIPTQEHLLEILRHLRGLDSRYHRTADLIELLAWSGMRKGEANAFRWGDIDWNRGLFAVTGGETGTKNHEVRHVPVFPQFREFLEAQRKRFLKESGEEVDPLGGFEGESAELSPLHLCMAKIKRFILLMHSYSSRPSTRGLQVGASRLFPCLYEE